MDSFNAKKDRAKKMKKDKVHSKARKKKGSANEVSKSRSNDTVTNTNRSTKVADEEESNSSGSDSEEYESQKYARSKIVSNQSYYDKSLPDVDPEPCAASLEELAAADDVTGGIFQFKGEADWASCPENISNQYFHIDLKQLASSLSAVPFYDRVNLFHDFFTSDEKQEMDLKAEQQFKLHSQNLGSTKNMKDLDQLLSSVKKQQNKAVEPPKTVSEPDYDNVSALTAQFKNVRSDLTDLLFSSEAQSVSTPNPSEKPQIPEEETNCSAQEETEDLNEWLDSILDD
ncbi:unnamed protein product [Bemisia tabaci]|uniref:Cell death regulator Aven n=1 Tax=Bemisia tabaci TaxID=7038 RepID=A0A9P0AJE6_BEMTA|nr:unnamed protein product [Bemisia tabaci]